MLRVLVLTLIVGMSFFYGSTGGVVGQELPPNPQDATPAPSPPQRCEVFISRTAQQLEDDMRQLYGIEPGSIQTWEDLVKAAEKLRDAGFFTLDTGEMVAPRIVGGQLPFGPLGPVELPKRPAHDELTNLKPTTLEVNGYAIQTDPTAFMNVMLIGSASLTGTLSVEAAGGEDTVTIRPLDTSNIRGGAGTEHPVLRSAGAGDELLAFALNGQRTWALTVNEAGLNGWIRRDLTDNPPGLDGLPVVADDALQTGAVATPLLDVQLVFGERFVDEECDNELPNAAILSVGGEEQTFTWNGIRVGLAGTVIFTADTAADGTPQIFATLAGGTSFRAMTETQQITVTEVSRTVGFVVGDQGDVVDFASDVSAERQQQIFARTLFTCDIGQIVNQFYQQSLGAFPGAPAFALNCDPLREPHTQDPVLNAVVQTIGDNLVVSGDSGNDTITVADTLSASGDDAMGRYGVQILDASGFGPWLQRNGQPPQRAEPNYGLVGAFVMRDDDENVVVTLVTSPGFQQATLDDGSPLQLYGGGVVDSGVIYLGGDIAGGVLTESGRVNANFTGLEPDTSHLFQADAQLTTLTLIFPPDTSAVAFNLGHLGRSIFQSGPADLNPNDLTGSALPLPETIPTQDELIVPAGSSSTVAEGEPDVPGLTPGEEGPVPEALVGESADTIRERSYVIEDILQCITFGGEITPDNLAGFVRVVVVNHPTEGRFFTVTIDPLVREALDEVGVSARLLVHTYDEDGFLKGAYIVEYGYGGFRGGPTDDGVTSTVNEYATSRGYTDGFVQVGLESTIVEAVLSSPSATSFSFTDDQGFCEEVM